MGVFYYITCTVIWICCWVTRQLWEKFWHELIPGEKNCYAEKIPVFLYKVKMINKPDFIIFFPVVLIQKSWLEMHMNKNVWIYTFLFISAVYTSKLWTTSFSETAKKFLQKHQFNWLEKLSRPCPKWLNDWGYAPNRSRSCVTTTLQPFSAWNHSCWVHFWS